jgi:hypothetical protein
MSRLSCLRAFSPHIKLPSAEIHKIADLFGDTIWETTCSNTVGSRTLCVSSDARVIFKTEVDNSDAKNMTPTVFLVLRTRHPHFMTSRRNGTCVPNANNSVTQRKSQTTIFNELSVKCVGARWSVNNLRTGNNRVICHRWTPKLPDSWRTVTIK